MIKLHDQTNRLYELVDGVLVEKVMGFDDEIAIYLDGYFMVFLKLHGLGTIIGTDGL